MDVVPPDSVWESEHQVRMDWQRPSYTEIYSRLRLTDPCTGSWFGTAETYREVGSIDCLSVTLNLTGCHTHVWSATTTFYCGRHIAGVKSAM